MYQSRPMANHHKAPYPSSKGLRHFEMSLRHQETSSPRLWSLQPKHQRYLRASRLSIRRSRLVHPARSYNLPSVQGSHLPVGSSQLRRFLCRPSRRAQTQRNPERLVLPLQRKRQLQEHSSGRSLINPQHLRLKDVQHPHRHPWPTVPRIWRPSCSSNIQHNGNNLSLNSLNSLNSLSKPSRHIKFRLSRTRQGRVQRLFSCRHKLVASMLLPATPP